MSQPQQATECSEPAPGLKPGSRVEYQGIVGLVKFASEQTVTLKAAINGRRCFTPDELKEI